MSEKGSHLIDMDKVLTRDRSGMITHTKFLVKGCSLQDLGTGIQDLRHCRYLNKTAID